MLLQHPARTLPLHHHHLNLLHTVYKCLGRDLVKVLFILSRKISCDLLYKVSKTTFFFFYILPTKGSGQNVHLATLHISMGLDPAFIWLKSICLYKKSFDTFPLNLYLTLYDMGLSSRWQHVLCYPTSTNRDLTK
jgi:hypothetical protein